MYPTSLAFTSALAAVASLITLGAGLSQDAHHGLDFRSDEPCKQVRDQAAKWMSDNGIVPKNSTELPTFTPATPAVPIRPSIAFACLKSVPLDKESALQHIDFLRPLFEWHSSVDYLRDPPQGFLSEGMDLMGGLDDIAAKLNRDKGGGYGNEFEFLADLYTMTGVRPRDSHFESPTLLLDLFDFPITAQFLSISDDGLTLPKIYLHDDVKHTQNGYTPSPVSTIDGIPALEFLQKASVNNGLSHDPDARFNSMFRSLATDASLAYASPKPFALSLRDTTKVKCYNGTTFEFSNAALLRANFSNIASGVDLYDVYGRGNATDEPPLWSKFYKLAERNYTTTFAGYPNAFKSAETGNIAGFLPDNPEFSDVAVLAVNSFLEPHTSEDRYAEFGLHFRDFYQVTVDLLSAAKAANRTKLILDFQGNGGGHLHNIMALYFALFPGDTLPFLWQSRAHPQLAWLGKHVWNASSAETPFPMTELVRPDGKPWSSFEELYGPFPDAPDGQKRWGEHTHPAMVNTTATLQSPTDNFPLPDGWQYQQPWTTPPFRPEDIVIVTDGQCASACAITTTILTHAHGIRTVAVGGRPLRAPMQAVGQIKGGPAGSFVNFPQIDRTQVPEGLQLPAHQWDSKPPLRFGGYQGFDVWSGSVTFNVGEMLPYNGNTSNLGQGEIPLQFRYEAANCRLFFTWEMARDITALWKAVVGAAWRGKKCAPGSTTNSDGTIGGVPGYTKMVEDRYRLGKGPGALKGK